MSNLAWIPWAAVVAAQRVFDERATRGQVGPVAVRFDQRAEAPRPLEWVVIADGVVEAASQEHLVGQRRSA